MHVCINKTIPIKYVTPYPKQKQPGCKIRSKAQSGQNVRLTSESQGQEEAGCM